MNRTAIITATLVWMGLIFYASSLPGNQTGPDTRLWTFVLKALHFMNFGVLALLYLIALKGSGRIGETGPGVFVISLLLTIVYAVSDEFHQKFSPGRNPSMKDIVIDTLGACVFLGASFALRKKAEKNLIPGRLQDTK